MSPKGKVTGMWAGQWMEERRKIRGRPQRYLDKIIGCGVGEDMMKKKY